MQKLEVFDPAMCCSTGICGPSVDPRLVRFSADLDWLKGQGVGVERFNLSQQPGAFAGDAAVKSALETKGEGALPLVKVNGEVKSTGVYPTREELSAWAGVAAPVSLYTPAVAELVAIGAALASNNEGSFKCHYDKARSLGVCDEDIRRAVATASVTRAHRMKAINEMVERLLGPAEAVPAAVAVVADPVACCAPSSDGSPTTCC